MGNEKLETIFSYENLRRRADYHYLRNAAFRGERRPDESMYDGYFERFEAGELSLRSFTEMLSKADSLRKRGLKNIESYLLLKRSYDFVGKNISEEKSTRNKCLESINRRLKRTTKKMLDMISGKAAVMNSDKEIYGAISLGEKIETELNTN